MSELNEEDVIIPAEPTEVTLAMRVAELEAENERLRNTLYDGDDYKDGLKDGMERAAAIAESDTFAPPYGIRLAKAIRAEIKGGE